MVRGSEIGTPSGAEAYGVSEPLVRAERRRGRGALSNRSGRFETAARESVDDGWEGERELEPFVTRVRTETARTILSRNDSPDLSFDVSINPYRGCEHGCVYCYARPTHAYLGHSPGLDFETELYAKANAAAVLEQELAKTGYVARPIALGAVTDPYQPIEREQRITRSLLEVLERASHPVAIVTKSFLVTRDLDVLTRMAAQRLVKVAVSVTTLDRELARSMEPRASAPHRRLEAIETLTAAGIPTKAMLAPIIPAVNDREIEALIEAVARAGAYDAGYVLLRLPLELKALWEEWLKEALPDAGQRTMALMRDMHGGKLYRSEFGLRQTGSGPYAKLIADRFRLARRRCGLDRQRFDLRTDLFRPPVVAGGQFDLFS